MSREGDKIMQTQRAYRARRRGARAPKSIGAVLSMLFTLADLAFLRRQHGIPPKPTARGR